ncbi:aKG-HExxH-type peptide beta-hydroxylase [Paraliomyxa miuraensis]|uniref:aKG-HExxH-type peptide beta-hydroxylase n=1 Tax=Paraliomyxa miuraensis TaxID=376150 RepID=UPI00225B6417|nr:HEXXH motif-containing putative peptide modification protein [Paraliomyxa miuraensis]MCX4245105.1 HEXXH motif-containing putative peptide modification protein [Paraliomyxa miuraensis]
MSERSHWASRLRSFVAAGPRAIPAPKGLHAQNAADVTEVILPLVARRTLKRLLRASLGLRASADVAAERDRLLATLLELPDRALEGLLVRPEVCGLVAGMENDPEGGAVLVPWLGQMVVGAVAAHGGDLAPTRVARSTRRMVTFPAAFLLGELGEREPSGTGTVTVSVRAGQVSVEGMAVGWRPLPRFDERVGISTGRDDWLDRVFPGVEHVASLDEVRTERFVRALDEAAAVLRRVWPEAHDELLALLRWIVPLANWDSWYVPGMHGLIALSVHDGRRMVRDLFHETSHHKLSRVLELASAARNPDHRVFSPFAKGKEPVISLLQSCWSFSREYALIQRLKASGYIVPAEVAREELKFRVLFDKGIPVLRREAQLTEVGDAILTSIEESIR